MSNKVVDSSHSCLISFYMLSLVAQKYFPSNFFRNATETVSIVLRKVPSEVNQTCTAANISDFKPIDPATGTPFFSGAAPGFFSAIKMGWSYLPYSLTAVGIASIGFVWGGYKFYRHLSRPKLVEIKNQPVISININNSSKQNPRLVQRFSNVAPTSVQPAASDAEIVAFKTAIAASKAAKAASKAAQAASKAAKASLEAIAASNGNQQYNFID